MTRAAIITLFVLVVLVAIAFGCDDSFTKHFDDVASVKKEDLDLKGWVPPFIPEDSTDITVSGDLDSATALGSFVSMNPDSLKKACSAAGDSFLVPYYASRWIGLGSLGDSNAGTLKSKGYEVLDCRAQNFNLAYSVSKHKFYYWRSRTN